MNEKVVPGLVSVVVASYNHATYLPRRMQSLVEQTYANIEILVIDDCSPDNSVEILQSYAENPQVKLILREENGGWITVSNQGVELSRGEYILFANCDDECAPQLVEQLVANLEANPSAGLAFCRSILIDEHSQPLGDDYTIRETAFQKRCATDTLISGNEMRRFLMHSCVIPNLSQALFRRSCFDQVGLFIHGYKACSDWDFFFRVSDQFDFAYVSNPLNHFRQHGRTIRTATKGRVTYDEFFRVLLGQINHPSFTALERSRFRLHTMYLWAVELLRPSTAGIFNLFHHARLVAKLDAPALLYLPLAIVQRAIELPAKAIARLTDR